MERLKYQEDNRSQQMGFMLFVFLIHSGLMAIMWLLRDGFDGFLLKTLYHGIELSFPITFICTCAINQKRKAEPVLWAVTVIAFLQGMPWFILHLAV